MPNTTSQRTSITLLIFGVFAVGPASIFIRLADAPATSIAAYRMLVAAAAVLIIVALRRGRDLDGIDRASFYRSVVSGLFLAVHFGTWIASLEHTSVANSVIIVTTQPIWAALLGIWYLRERVRPGALAAIGLALVGVLIISGGNPRSGGWYGDGLALIGAVTAAAYLVVGRQVRQRVATFGYVAVAYSTAAIALGAWALIVNAPLRGFTGMTWMWMIVAGLGPSVIGHTIYNRALKDFSAHTVATTILGGETLVATMLAMMVLAEYPSPWAILGAVPIAVGGIWVLRLERSHAVT